LYVCELNDDDDDDRSIIHVLLSHGVEESVKVEVILFYFYLFHNIFEEVGHGRLKKWSGFSGDPRVYGLWIMWNFHR